MSKLILDDIAEWKKAIQIGINNSEILNTIDIEIVTNIFRTVFYTPQIIQQPNTSDNYQLFKSFDLIYNSVRMNVQFSIKNYVTAHFRLKSRNVITSLQIFIATIPFSSINFFISSTCISEYACLGIFSGTKKYLKRCFMINSMNLLCE